jgi:CheY-like chemotaxis protein
MHTKERLENLIVDNEELAAVLINALKEPALLFKKTEKTPAQLMILNKEMADELMITHQELAMEIDKNELLEAESLILNEKNDKRIKEIVAANKKIASLSAELLTTHQKIEDLTRELFMANTEKAQRAAELILVNKEKARHAAELIIANKEKAKRAAEFIIANKEKAKHAAELIIANKEYAKRAAEERRTIEKIINGKEEEFAFNSLKVLVAEKDEMSNLILPKIFQNIAKEILHAKTGVEALTCCMNNPDIDLVLMDIRMLETNRYKATRQIRQFNKDLIIIAQTARGFIWRDRKKAIKAGCNDYITKPIDKTILHELINKHCNKKCCLKN